MNTKYRVIESHIRKDFEQEVNKAISRGAQLVGGVSTHVTAGNEEIYCQAVTEPQPKTLLGEQ